MSKYIFKKDDYVPKDHFFYLRPSLWYSSPLPEKPTIFFAPNIKLTKKLKEQMIASIEKKLSSQSPSWENTASGEQ